MKKCFFFLLLCLGLACPATVGAWNNTEPAPETNCNLPAPANLQANQPTPTTVTFKWNSVAGATGYYASLLNLGNPPQVVAYPTDTTVTFSVNPGDTCVFTVAARCSSGETSNNTSIIGFRASSIVIELIAERSGCTPNTKIAEGGPNTVFSGNWSNGNYYFAEMRSGGQSLFFQFRYKEASGRFEYCGFSTNPQAPTSQLYGLNIYSTVYEPAPSQNGIILLSSNLKEVYTPPFPDQIGRIAFNSPTEIYYYYQDGESTFPLFSIYNACTNGKPGGLANNPTPGFVKSSEENARELLSGIRPANPFAAELPLFFFEYPEQALTARLFDASGRLFLEQHIAPEDVSENRYALPTATLPPGFYFLQLETAPGVMETWKVVKT